MKPNQEESLKLDIQFAKYKLDLAVDALSNFKSLPENNVFDSLKEAEYTIEDKLTQLAHDGCEGSYNCGEDEYSQEFIVDGVHYIGTLEVEYNRHDKTYYYIDGTDFSIEQKDENK